MKNRPSLAVTALVAVTAATLLTGCSVKTFAPAETQPPAGRSPVAVPPAQPAPPAQEGPSNPPATKTDSHPGGTERKTGSNVVPDPNDITLLVNKSFKLPDGYAPDDLVEPQVAFIFQEKVEKRLMRKEAAEALERMFAGAKKDGIDLAGVSGYRSYETQAGLFNYYVKTQGEETARQYSAEPGHSEHQTGLAMDVSGATGACAVEDCFAGTPEADWLAAHSAEYGFIIRYPKGKEDITGYAYEPWHLRYVGKPLAMEIAAKGLTLEEYYATRR